MLDFDAVRKKEKTFDDLLVGLTTDDLRQLTNEMVDTMQELIAGARDQDVQFEPEDPGAHDAAAKTEAEVKMPWTLGHVIVHVTASAEEAAFLAAEMARGVPPHGRSRSELHWTEMETIEDCRLRLEESRRMRLATLDVWPDKPFVDNIQQSERSGNINCYKRFIFGLSHDDSHLDHIKDIVEQAQAARQG